MWQRQMRSVEAVVLWGAVAASLAIIGCGERKKKEALVEEVGRLTPRPASVETGGGEVSMGTTTAGPVSFADAQEAYNTKRFTVAVEMFKGYTESKPENAWGHFMLGLSAWKSGDTDQAESELLKAIELDSTHLKSRYNLARVYLDKGDGQKAAEQVEKGLTLDSASSEGFRLQGRVREELGMFPEAEESYRHALEIDGKDVWAMNNLGLNLVRQGKFERAVSVLARVTQLKPENPTFQNNLGMALELSGYFTGATKAYQSAVTLDGSHQKAIDNLARVEKLEDKAGLPVLDLEALAKTFTTRQ